MTGFAYPRIAIGVVFALAAFASNSVAAASVEDRFETIDANSDSRIDPEEMRVALGKIFATMDKNGDRVISGAEHPALQTADGKPIEPKDVNLADYMANSSQAFATYDSDSDGFISRAEFEQSPKAVDH